MVEANTPVTHHLLSAIHTALEAGVARDDLLDMVNIAYLQMAGGTVNPQAKGNGYKGLELATDDNELPIYTELPEGLVDLPSAAAEYSCTVQRFRGWIQKGYISPQGRLRAGCPGGGYLVVAREDLERQLAASPNKGGRPRKNPLAYA